MVNYHDPVVIADQRLGVVKMMHACAGFYAWEFLSTLDYEWSVYMGMRPWRWTFVIYWSIRISTLGTIASYLVAFSMTTKYNCVGWLLTTFVLSCVSLVLSSALIGMRAIALWNRNTFVIGLVAISWLVNLSFQIYGISRARYETTWNPLARNCIVHNAVGNRASIITTMISDVILLGSMFVGVTRTRNPGGLWKLLHRQGIIWIGLATLSEVPLVVLLALNLNDPLDLIFQPVTLIILAIAATRMQRDLAVYTAPNERTLSDTDPMRFQSGPIGHSQGTGNTMMGRGFIPQNGVASLNLEVSGKDGNTMPKDAKV